MPFSGFRDRLASSSKPERDLPPTRPSTLAADGTESILTTSSTSSTNSAAIEQLRTRPTSADPVQFVQDAISPLFTWNSKHEPYTLDDLVEHHVPRYFAPDYKHNFNLAESDMDIWVKRLKVIHQKTKKTRVRYLKTLIDTSERQSMQHALVSLHYEIVVTIPNREEDVRLPGHGIYRIQHGKLVSAMVVVDAHEISMKGPEIPACVIA